MHKIKLILLITVIILVSSSCTGRNSRTRMLDGMDNDEEKMDTRLKQVFEAIENKDKEKFKSMFSKKALDKAENLDENMDYIFEFFQGKVVSWDRKGVSIPESFDDGHITKQITLFYDVETDIQKYIFYFVEWLDDTDDADIIGLYSLHLIKKEDEFVGNFTYDDMKPGIHRSDISEEENSSSSEKPEE